MAFCCCHFCGCFNFASASRSCIPTCKIISQSRWCWQRAIVCVESDALISRSTTSTPTACRRNCTFICHYCNSVIQSFPLGIKIYIAYYIIFSCCNSIFIIILSTTSARACIITFKFKALFSR